MRWRRGGIRTNDEKTLERFLSGGMKRGGRWGMVHSRKGAQRGSRNEGSASRWGRPCLEDEDKGISRMQRRKEHEFVVAEARKR